MQPPAIQLALDNLVEAVRTSLMAEFLDLLRAGKPAGKPGRKPRAAVVPTLKEGGRRSSEDVGQIGKKVLVYLKAHPDQRVEQIAKDLKTDTRGLKLPILKLLADKKISKRGQRRGTTYRAKAEHVRRA